MVGSTDIGMKRKNNQDSIFFDSNLKLGIVCDGIGGRNGGEVASSLAVNTIRKYIQKKSDQKDVSISRLMKDAIRKANQAILISSEENPEYSGMGTTINGLIFDGKKAYVGHVGDSRTYFYYQGNLWQVTMDHSVADFLKHGLIDPNIITKNAKPDALVRALGLKEELEVDVYELPLVKGGLILSCSDGLSGMVSDEEILKIIDKNIQNLQSLPKLLIAEANRMGGQDNITVFIAHVEGNVIS